MLAVMFVMLFTPIFVIMGFVDGKRLAAHRGRRLQAYRASPESHLPHLNK